MKNLLFIPFIFILFFSCGGNSEPRTENSESENTEKTEGQKVRKKGAKGLKNEQAKKKGKGNKKGKGAKAKKNGAPGPNPPVGYSDWGLELTDEQVNDFILKNQSHECFNEIPKTLDLKASTQVTGCDWMFTMKACTLPSSYNLGKYEDVIYVDKSSADGEAQYEVWAIFEGKFDLETVKITKSRKSCMKKTGFYDIVLSAEEDSTAQHNALIIGMGIKVVDVPTGGTGIVFRYEREKKKSKKIFAGSIVKFQ